MTSFSHMKRQSDTLYMNNVSICLLYVLFFFYTVPKVDALHYIVLFELHHFHGFS